ncbi:MAG: GAF domain-containing protein [Gemmatimonadetes bacterium]|nr:GAF domain-containing protein [Gemmatimonadota bacterium]
MQESTLVSLAHALAAAPTVDAAFVALAEGLEELDRAAAIAYLPLAPRDEHIVAVVRSDGGKVTRANLEVSLRQFPEAVVRRVQAGGAFVDVGDEGDAYARMLLLPALSEPGELSLRGIRFDGELTAVLALLEPRRVFGARVTAGASSLAALFELAHGRFAERDARAEAAHTLEDVTQRVHGEYVARLADMQQQLHMAKGAADAAKAGRAVQKERETARVAEEARRNAARLRALEQQVTAAVSQLEQAHIELHRRSEALRQRTRTIYLLDRVLEQASHRVDPRRLAEGLLALVGDDMQAMRCSLFLRAPEPATLYLAASRGLAPHVREGSRITVGQGVAGRVAESRQPLLVVDASDAQAQPLLRDEYLTTGSFISFPLVIRDELIGVVNLTNRAQRGLFVEEDVERVRLLGLVISLIALEARLPELLLDRMHD